MYKGAPNVSLGRKIFASFSVIILFVILIVGVVWFQLTKISNETEDIVNDAVPLSNAANNILTALVNQETGVRGYLVTEDEAYLEPYYSGQEEINNNLEIIHSHLDGHPIMASLIEEATPKMEQIQQFFESEIELVKQGKFDEARARIGDGKEFFDSYRESHQLIVEDTVKLTNDAWNNVESAHNQSLLIINVIAVLIIALVIVISLYLIRNISRPVAVVSQSLNEVADGNLSIPQIEVKTKDEIGVLATSLNKMVEDLKDTISKTQESAMHVAASSEQLTASAEQSTQANEVLASLAQTNFEGADNQLNKINNTTSSIADMTRNVNAITDSSKEMEKTTDETATQVTNGMKSVEKVVEKIYEIKTSFNTMNENIQSLNSRSNEIGSILNMITDISEQTNLLALNAAIEAARAGDHGKGFAVVADEVRVLAEESKKSADQIAEMVRDMQNETETVVHSINDGNQKVEEGISSTEEAKGAFQQIESSMSEVANKVSDVSASIQDIEVISRAIEKELESVKDIAEKSVENNQESSSATEEQLATMEEISSSAQSLSALAEDLQAVIAHFKMN